MVNFNRDKNFGRRDDRRSDRVSDRDSGRTTRDGFSSRNPNRDSFDRRDSGSSRIDRQMHWVTCDKCGERCEVPFRPSNNKPVYCSQCFRKNESSGSTGDSAKDFAIINEKLDKIMQTLHID